MSTQPYNQAPSNVIPLQQAEERIITVQTEPTVFDQAPELFDAANPPQPGESTDITLTPNTAPKWDKEDAQTAIKVFGILALFAAAGAVNTDKRTENTLRTTIPEATRHIEMHNVAKTQPGDTIKLPANPR